MPSLPELEVYKQELSRQIIGQPITRVEPLDFRVVRVPVEAIDGLLVGRAISAIHRYGKWLYLNVQDKPEQLVLHLGLTGKLRLVDNGTKLPRNSALAISFQDGPHLVMTDQRHLGKVYVKRFTDLQAEKQLGPDLLDTTQDYFMGLGAKHRGIRDVLMDQHLVAGIGGKYADEILWQAKIHPSTKASLLSQDQLAHIFKLTQSITETAISLGADVESFPSDWLIPHRHTDKICPRCGTVLVEYSTGGSAAVHCPHCQPAPQP